MVPGIEAVCWLTTTRATRPWATSSRLPSSTRTSTAGARTGIELTLETAKELRAALDRAIAAAEFEKAEVQGNSVVVSTAQREESRRPDRCFANESRIDVAIVC